MLLCGTEGLELRVRVGVDQHCLIELGTFVRDRRANELVNRLVKNCIEGSTGTTDLRKCRIDVGLERPIRLARYNGVTRILTSIDPIAAGNAYGTLKPYIDAAFAEIGRPSRPFDALFHQAGYMLV